MIENELTLLEGLLEAAKQQAEFAGQHLEEYEALSNQYQEMLNAARLDIKRLKLQIATLKASKGN